MMLDDPGSREGWVRLILGDGRLADERSRLKVIELFDIEIGILRGVALNNREYVTLSGRVHLTLSVERLVC
jgi:hypothetical protein